MAHVFHRRLLEAALAVMVLVFAGSADLMPRNRLQFDCAGNKADEVGKDMGYSDLVLMGKPKEMSTCPEE